MDESTRRRMTLTVSLKPGHLFLNSLMAMTTMASWAVLVVKDGGIQVLASSRDRKARSSLIMEASTASSLPSNRYAIRFDLSTWNRLLTNPVLLQLSATITIFKIADSTDLQCTVGDDSVPFKLSEANFVQTAGIDINRLMVHRVAITLQPECFREVLATCARRYEHAMMRVLEDKVTFLTTSNMLMYSTEDGDCMILGVEPGTILYIMLQWRIAMTLDTASGLSKDILIIPLTDPQWMEWVLFSFRFDEKAFFACMMQGSDVELF